MPIHIIFQYVDGLLAVLGGRIYFGLQLEEEDTLCVVHGIKMNRDQRDEFRQGVDRTMERLLPIVMQSCYEIKYVKVVAFEGHENPQC